MVPKDQFIEQLKSIGIKPGMSLMVHSSLKKIGKVEGGANTIIDSLLEVLGPEGTLMMSTVSGNVNPGQTVFHPDYTQSTVGLLSNIFRKRDNVLRSLHPIHSITAYGPKAKFFTDGHFEANTPWSPDSPYGKIMRNDGFILFLGVNFECNTCLHALEIEARVPGLYREDSTTLTVFDTNNNMHFLEHHWHAPKKDSYIDMEHIVEKAGGLTYGIIGNGTSRLVDANILRKTILPILQETPDLAIRRLTDSTFIWEP
jgi:aminoglycoside 3-N-acetyltransferase